MFRVIWDWAKKSRSPLGADSDLWNSRIMQLWGVFVACPESNEDDWVKKFSDRRLWRFWNQIKHWTFWKTDVRHFFGIWAPRQPWTIRMVKPRMTQPWALAYSFKFKQGVGQTYTKSNSFFHIHLFRTLALAISLAVSTLGAPCCPPYMCTFRDFFAQAVSWIPGHESNRNRLTSTTVTVLLLELWKSGRVLLCNHCQWMTIDENL